MKKRIYMLVIVFIVLLFTSCTSEDNLTSIYRSVYSFIEDARFQNAIDILENEITVKNRDFKFFSTLGFCYFENIDTLHYMRHANKNLLKAYNLDNSNYNNTYLLASSFEEMQDINNAKKYFNKAIEIWETVEGSKENFINDPYFRYARLLTNDKNFELAFQYIEKSLEVNTNNTYAILQKGFILAKLGDFEALYDYYQKTLEIAPSQPLHKRDYGKMLIELGRLNEAYIFFSNIKNDLSLSSVDHFYATVELAYLELVNKNYNAALIYLEEAKNEYANYLPHLKYWCFYYWLISEDNKAYNQYKIYRYFAENLENLKFDIYTTDVPEMIEYFKDDVYFTVLKGETLQ